MATCKTAANNGFRRFSSQKGSILERKEDSKASVSSLSGMETSSPQFVCAWTKSSHRRDTSSHCPSTLASNRLARMADLAAEGEGGAGLSRALDMAAGMN